MMMIPLICLENYTNENIAELEAEYLWETKTTKQKISSLRKQQDELLKQCRTVSNRINTDYKEAWIWELILLELKLEQDKVTKQIKFYQWEDNPKKTGEINLEQAKTRLISDFMQFNKAGFALCLWHTDSHPSLKYDKKRNKVHCFACGVDKDVIDTVQAQHQYDFITAVKFLTN